MNHNFSLTKNAIPLSAIKDEHSVGVSVLDPDNWRHAYAILGLPKSKFAEFEPFRNKHGNEVIRRSDNGRAYASDGVHYLLRDLSGRWFTRSSQVVKLAPEPKTGYEGKTAEYGKDADGKQKTGKVAKREKELNDLVGQYL